MGDIHLCTILFQNNISHSAICRTAIAYHFVLYSSYLKCPQEHPVVNMKLDNILEFSGIQAICVIPSYFKHLVLSFGFLSEFFFDNLSSKHSHQCH